MKKSYKSNIDTPVFKTSSTDIEQPQTVPDLEEVNKALMKHAAHLKAEEAMEAVINEVTSSTYSRGRAYADYVPKMPGFTTSDSIQPC